MFLFKTPPFTHIPWSWILLPLWIVSGACSADVSWNETAVSDESVSLRVQEWKVDKDRDEASMRAVDAREPLAAKNRRVEWHIGGESGEDGGQ